MRKRFDDGRSRAMVDRYVRDTSLFADNASAGIGL